MRLIAAAATIGTAALWLLGLLSAGVSWPLSLGAGLGAGAIMAVAIRAIGRIGCGK